MGKQLTVQGAEITAVDDALFFNALSREKNGILKQGSMLQHQVISSNEIRIKDGFIQVQGRNYVIYPNDYDSVTIENGAQGLKRYDLIVFEISKTGGQESLSIKAIKGTAAATPSDPVLVQENTFVNGSKFQFPLYRVKLNGINIEGVDDLRTYIGSSAVTKIITLLANGWSSTDKTYTINDPLITATSIQEYDFDPNATIENDDILSAAKLTDGGQGTGWAKLKAKDDIPTVDVTIRVIFMGEI